MTTRRGKGAPLGNLAGYRSVRISADYRALGVPDGPDVIWIWVGPYQEYELLLKRARKK